MQGNQRTKHTGVRGSRSVEHRRISHNTSTIVQLSKMSCQNQDRLHSFENNRRVLL